MSIKDYIDTKFNLNKITSISSYNAERINKTDIYLVDNNVKHKINANIIVQGVNDSGKGTIVAINHTGAIYFEHLGYYEPLSNLLDNIKDFMNNIATQPIGQSTQGPVTATPDLIAKAQQISNQIEVLKKGLP